MDAGLAGLTRAATTTAVVVVIDQAAKQLLVARLGRGESVDLVPGLDLTHTRNTGVAFGALDGAGTLVGILIGLSLALLAAYFVLHAARPGLWLPVGMLFGGALGNLADRVREGAVIDFLDPVAWPAFNLADASIVFGVFALLYLAERGGGRPR